MADVAFSMESDDARGAAPDGARDDDLFEDIKRQGHYGRAVIQFLIRYADRQRAARKAAELARATLFEAAREAAEYFECCLSEGCLCRPTKVCHGHGVGRRVADALAAVAGGRPGEGDDARSKWEEESYYGGGGGERG
jgi:hypothetical protein